MIRNVLVYTGALLAAACLVTSGWALMDRFSQGTKSRIAICRSENTLRQVLHDEHVKKLASQLSFLDQHPNGIPGISRRLILQAIADEREIVAKTKPRDCS